MGESKRRPLRPDELMAIEDNDELLKEHIIHWILDGRPREYFGAAALFFNCERCGVCCTTFDDISISRKEIQKLADHLGMSEQDFRNKYTRNLTRDIEPMELRKEDYVSLLVPCPFYSDKGCSVYDYRPKVCVLFPCFLSLQAIESLDGVVKVNPACKVFNELLMWVDANDKIVFQKEGEFLDRAMD